MTMPRSAGWWFADQRATSSGDLVRVLVSDETLDFADGAAAELRHRSLAALDARSGTPVTWMNQVHGRVVARVDEPAASPTADALVTTGTATALGARSADCVPVLLADRETGAIAAVHAGRLGVALNVVGAALDALLAEDGGRATAVTAWIGPHVCGACYEVPADLRAEVATVVPEAFAETSWGTPALDLGAGVAAQLAEREVAEVVSIPGCTREEPRLHSHRRDAGGAGRLAAVIWRQPSSGRPEALTVGGGE